MHGVNGRREWTSDVPQWLAGAAVVALLVIAPAVGHTFSYSENFNDWQNMPHNGSEDTLGRVPVGWLTTNYPNPDEVQINPQVFNVDGLIYSPTCWGEDGGCYDPEWRSGLGAAGVQDYTVPWSGTPGDLNMSGRFTILHMNWETFGRTSNAWYTGVAQNGYAARHTGTYPMNLKTNSFKAEFDLLLRTGNSRGPGDGASFIVQPVQDLDHISVLGVSGAQHGWNGLGGFAIEFDLWPNNGDPSCCDNNDIADNHMGLQVALKYDISEDNVFGSLMTNMDTVGQFPFNMVKVGDNNQPLHVTVYYNDPDHGGPGALKVYLKVDPATKADGEPAVPEGQTPFSYGMDEGDVAEGKLVLDACLGAWPSENAVFGFAGSCGWATVNVQVDNVNVETNPVEGTVCVATWAPTFNAGELVTLTDGPVASDATGLSQPGWDVTSYVSFADTWAAAGLSTPLDTLKASIGYQAANGLYAAQAVGEPDLNYLDTGTDGIFPYGRRFPGFPVGDNDNFGILAKGYIFFPPGVTYPREYSLCVSSDNECELMIGNQLVIRDTTDGNWGNGVDALNSGRFANVQVSAPGAYPIQILYGERWGGAMLEVYRRTGDPLNPFVRLGSPDLGNEGFGDQPVIYGLFNGRPAQTHIADYPQFSAVTVTLSPTQKVGDVSAATGEQVFNIKTVHVGYPNIGIQNQYEDDYRQVGLGFLDSIDNMAPADNRTADQVNFQGSSGQNTGPLPFKYVYPGVPEGAGNIGLRAEGFATFASAGLYILGLEGDDDVYLRFGNQTVINQPCCYNQRLVLYVPEAGTYPIRVDNIGAGGDDRVKLYEVSPSYGIVAVNSAESRVKVFQASTTGAFAFQSQSFAIKPDRKVAEVGQGGELGWSATAVKGIDGVTMDNNMGLATAHIENNLAGVGAGLLTQAFDTPLYINYADISQTGGEFQAASASPQDVADISIAGFLKADGTPLFTECPDGDTAQCNNDYALSFTGYIEFPEAGHYSFNTNCDDGSYVWIAGEIVARYPLNSGPGDNTPGTVYVAQPGIYDIRMDNFERNWGAEVELVQYLPDGATRVLLNDPKENPSSKRVKVYRTLATTPATTEFHNPVFLPAGAKAAEIFRGGQSGARLQFANAKFVIGDGGYGVGQDKFRTPFEAREMMASVFDGVPSLSQYGTAAVDATFETINFSDDSFPAGVNAEYYAMRATGVLALAKGGHVFEISSDDAFIVTMAGKTVGQNGWIHGAYPVRFYVNAAEDGLYPFTLEYFQGNGGHSIVFNEVLASLTTGLTSEVVNTGNAAKMYVGVSTCPYPSADGDGDGDVDQVDFGLFQACFTADTAPEAGLTEACKCFDKDFDADVDVTDFGKFYDCITGPAIKWTQELRPNCQP